MFADHVLNQRGRLHVTIAHILNDSGNMFNASQFVRSPPTFTHNNLILFYITGVGSHNNRLLQPMRLNALR